MLCARCSSPLPPAASRCARCDAPATIGPGASYSLAMSTALHPDLRADTQPELPRLMPGVAPGRYDTRPIYRSSLGAVLGAGLGSSPSGVAADAAPTEQMRAVAPARAYTLAHLLDDTFGRDAAPAAAIATTRMQAALVRLVGARRAVGRWTPAATGALVATMAGLALALVAQLLSNLALGLGLRPDMADATTGFAEQALQALLGGSPLKLFALANLVPVLLAPPAGEIIQPHLQLTAPLSALLLIPALALLLGGALASGSDFERRARYSVARGALIGPFYAILLTIIAVVGGGRVAGQPLGLTGDPLLLAAPNSALFYGLIWGTAFGALGGWLQLHGRGWRRAALARLAALRLRRLAGALAGAGVALATGLLASLVVIATVAAYIAVSGQAPAPLANAVRVSDLLATPAGGLGLALAVLALAPSLVVWAWCYASGVPVDVDRVTYAHGGAFGSDFATLGLFGPPHLAWTLLALVPLACYFLGGRVAARLAGARRPGGAFVAGALVALPLTLLSALLASLATLGIQATVPAGTLIVDVSPSATANLLPIFLVTALVAGFGGRSAVTRPGLGASVTVRLVKPGRARRAFFGALDRLIGRHPRARLGLPRALAYTGILAACALSLLLLALDAANLALMPRLPDGLLPALDGAAAALLVAIPLACFAAALCARLVGGLARPVGPDASLVGRTPARSSARHPAAISR